MYADPKHAYIYGERLFHPRTTSNYLVRERKRKKLLNNHKEKT